GFSGDSQYLAYLHWPAYSKTWTLTLIELATDKKTHFTGTAADGGSPRILGWGPDDKGLYLEITPGRNAGPYYVDLGKITPGKTSALPRLVPIFKGLKGAMATGQMRREPVSPDGTRVAFLYYDPRNPPDNFQPEQ